MAELTLHLSDGRTETRHMEAGIRLWDVIEPMYRDAPCGGNGRCGKCRVQATGQLSAPSQQERELLGGESTGWRLACLTYIEGDAEVTLRETTAAREICGNGLLPSFERKPLYTQYGAVVDIGTTTLAAQLYGRDGRKAAQATVNNPQSTFGADVISRIEKSLAGGRKALALCIQQGVLLLLERLAAEAGIPTEKIETVVITGNTTMLYLLTERDVDCLSHAPFAADELFGRWAYPEELASWLKPSTRVYLPRCISAFVGADVTTALLASEICRTQESALLADIGTNGEVALWHSGRLHCCSTAAGPVFEGAGISCGMQGVDGAVSHVAWENGSVQCSTIGDAAARGICGSGIVDAAAVFCRQGIIDETGAFSDGRERYPLTDEIGLTQKDIRMIQLGKSAICAGIRTVLKLTGVTTGEVSCLAVAGGFGSYLDLHSAATIGLYPAELEAKAKVLGNAALMGAAMLLLQEGFLRESFELAQRAETIELSSSPVFMEYYLDDMSF